ncbi:Regulation of nuclear pre-mRNA domain-containing protein 1A [Euphorbia peplus]|nr:Regulation of nuclear pre-mRNA domain-containing protein 1A [Euphorbia peplus]
MASSFNPQILVEKLAKLNPSQASIETLSHWCIFHMNKAKQVVETWDRQFHCSPREQRLAFLYLANDILQNSRRKGSEFVGEFWKVLPGALRYVIDSGDEAGRNSALRLVNIWEERKVFGSRGQTLKDEIMGKHPESSNRNGKHVDLKLKQSAGSSLDKIISGYQVVHSGQGDEDVIINKCRNAISCFEKAEKEVDSNINSGQLCTPAFAVELQGQHAILRDSINQLTALELSRAGLVSQLREALQEEESKLEQIRNQLQAAQSQLENANKVCQQLVHSSNGKLVAEESSKDVGTSIASKSFTPGDRDQSAPAMYRRQASFPEKSNHVEEDPRKSAAAAVAAKLTASTSSAQMLSYVLSSLASEGVIGNSVKESSSEYQPEKRAKLENDQPYIPSQNPAQPPLSTYQHPEPYQIATTGQQLTSNDPPPPPSSPPPLPPLPPMPAYSIPQYLQTAGSINAAQYGYSMSQQQPPSLTGYPGVGTQMTGISPFSVPASNLYQSYQGPDGNLYTQQSSMPMAPISRQ